MPGGGGRWGCVGMNLTEWLLALVFSHVLRRFDWSLEGPPPKPRHGMLLLPDKRPTRASYRPLSRES